ncbi:hypothetical protein OQA88_4326 [Cercophora sp. LCS_1]
MSSDIYTPFPETAYVLGVSFSMTSSDGDRWAVSYSGSMAITLTASISVIVLLAFVNLWSLFCFTAVFFDGRGTRCRYTALVTIWNAGKSWSAVVRLVEYTLSCARSLTGSADAKVDLLFGAALSLLSLGIFSACVIMCIVTPSLIHIGQVAPVESYRTSLDTFTVRARAFLRALDSAEAAQVTLRSKSLSMGTRMA